MTYLGNPFFPVKWKFPVSVKNYGISLNTLVINRKTSAEFKITVMFKNYPTDNLNGKPKKQKVPTYRP